MSFCFLCLFSVIGVSKDALQSPSEEMPISKRIAHYNLLSKQYASIDLDSCVHFHEMALELALKENDDEEIWTCLSTILEDLIARGAYEKAKNKIDFAFNQLNLKNNPLLRVRCLLPLVKWNWRVSNLAEAQKHLNIARGIAEERKYWKELGEIYNYYAIISKRIPELEDQCDSYYEKAIEAYQVINDSLGQAKVLNNQSYGDVLKTDYENALNKIDLALQLIDNKYSDHNLEYLIANKADALIGLGRNEEGFQLIEEGIQSVILNNKKHLLSIFYELKSKNLFKIKEFEKGIEVSLQGLEITTIRDQQIRMYDKIAEAYSELGNYKQTLSWTEKSLKAKEDLLKVQKSDEVVKLQVKYKVEKQDSEKQVLLFQSRNLSLLITLSIILSVGTIAILLFVFRSHQQKKLEQVRQSVALDLKQEVGTKLRNISRLASDLHGKVQCPDAKCKLTKLVNESSTVAQNMTDVIWAMDNEKTEWRYLLEKMEDYLEEVKLNRKELKISFEKNGLNESNQLPLNVRHHLLMIFKEAINNIQKHTISSIINVQVNDKPDTFRMTISNKFDKKVNNSKSTGRGLKNIKRRINELKGEVFVKTEEGYFNLTIQLPPFN